MSGKSQFSGQDPRGQAAQCLSAPHPRTIHEAVVESLQDAIVILGEHGCVEMCNTAAERLFARPRSQLCGQPSSELLRSAHPGPGEDLATWQQSVATSERSRSRLDMAAVGADGAERPVEVTAVDLHGSRGRRCLVICDITADRSVAIKAARLSILQQIVTRATTTLIASSTLNESMASALRSIGEILDVAHAFVLRVRTCGDAATLTTPAEWSSSKLDPDARGMIGAALLRDEHVREQLAADRIVAIGDSEQLDTTTTRMMRERGVRSMILVPIHCPDVLEGVLGFDETRRGREWSVDERAVLSNLAQALARSIERVRVQWSLEEAQKRSNEALVRAEAANEAKSEFLANVSHELRTPLTAIVGYADLAARANTSLEDRIRMSTRIQRSADFLLGLINDVLDLSKIESRKMAVSLAPIDLAELVDDVVLSLNWIAEDKGLEVSVDMAPDVPSHVVSDAQRLRQMLVNLVSNGLKFTSSGSVTVAVSYESPVEKAVGVLTLRVRDTGIGIRPEKVKELFSKFTQVHTDRKYGGTGLGLAITRHLARLLSGDVEVESEFGEGSTFTIAIPVEVPAGARAGTTHEARLSDSGLTTPVQGDSVRAGTRLLVADDNEDNREIFRLVLEAAGAVVTTVEHGQLAVDAVQAAEQEKEPFDLVLMDMNMPILDGYGATRVLRDLGQRVPIVALTAFSMATDRDKCLAAGCDGYLTKPIRPEVLVREVAKRTALVVAVSGAAGSTLEGTDDYEELLATFCRVVGQRIVKIRTAFADGDGERLRALVHQLKGSAGCYGFSHLVAAAASCEDQLRGGHDVASVAAMVDEIERLVAEIGVEADSPTVDRSGG